MVENTGGKGEIARYKQFLLFPQCFQKTCTGKGLTKGQNFRFVQTESIGRQQIECC